MPASAALPPSVPFPVASTPHASGTRIAQQPAHLLMRPQHKHGHSADYADSNQAQKSTRSHHAHARLSEQMLSKPLPIKPEQDHDIYSRPTDAQRYRDQSLQKLEEREGYRGPSLDLPRNQAPSSSVGRSRSATVAAPHSSASRGSTGAKRKPVQATPAEFFEWAPGDEAQVIASPTANDMPTGSHKSRHRNMGVYRDPPVHPKDTWSRATAPKLNERQGLSASVGHQPTSQSHFVISSSSLGRHHHSASASVPSTTLPGSARSTIQNFPTTPTPANSSSNQKIPFISTSTATTPTPKAQTFNKGSTKQYKHSSVSNHDLPSEERRRKLSHHRTASASTNPQSPSSCSTTGSSHADTIHSTASQEPRQRRRGTSDAAAHQTYHIPVSVGRSEVSVVKIGGEDEERGRTKDKKDSSFIGRLRTRSNSFTKTLSNMITYPKYLKKDKEKEKEKDAKRLSKQQQQQAQSSSNLGQSGSAILASASDNGHSFAYSYTSSNSATSASTAASPNSSHNHNVPPPPRPRKILHSRDQQMKNDYRASPMTKAKDELLTNFWGDVDLPRRESGFVPMQIQVSETRTRLGPMIPFMNDEPKPRRR